MSQTRSSITMKREKANALVSAGAFARVPPIVHDVLRSPGRPLEASTRSFMEPRFGHDLNCPGASGALQASPNELQVGPADDPHEREADAVADRVMNESSPARAQRGFDFSQVRIHTDEHAAQSARALNAAAYTVGRDIVFAEGQYQPTARQGQRLLAHELTHVAQQSNGTSPAVQRQPARTRVTISTEGTCANERDLAQAIPGARAMADTAMNWFISLNDRDRARVALLLRANFLSDSDDVRDAVFTRIVSMARHLAAAQDGRITFVCAPATDTNCGDREGYVLDTERNRIHICPVFFSLTPEGRQWMLVHECAHLAGAMRLPESYYATFGAMGEEQCRQGSVSGNTREALENADNYARLIWCLTRPPGIVITPPTATP